MKPLTAELQKKIRTYVKNGIDISDLIVDVDLRKADLSYAIIKKLKVIERNIDGCNFAHAKIGSDDDIIMFIRSKVRNCNFFGVQFVGKTFMRSCDARGSNFKNADITKASYEHTDFTNCDFCNTAMRIGTKDGIGCKFDKKLFLDLTKYMELK